MTKKVSVFICIMLAIIMTTGVSFAKTEQRVEVVNRGTYNEQFIGTASEFWARATTSKAYATIENTSSGTRYLTCQIFEYKANIGYTADESSKETVLPGIQINATLDRNIDLIGFYYCAGTCNGSQYGGGGIDFFSFKAYQQMDTSK